MKEMAAATVAEEDSAAAAAEEVVLWWAQHKWGNSAWGNSAQTGRLRGPIGPCHSAATLHWTVRRKRDASFHSSNKCLDNDKAD